MTVISTKQICIAVYDSDKKPLSGALVHLVNTKDSKRTKDVVTDSDGRAVFWVSDLGADEKTDMKLGLRVTADGYQTHEIQTVKIRGGESVSVHLKKDDQTPYLVMACFNGRDILNEESSFYYSKKNNVKHTFSVKLSCAGSGELEMRYPTDAAGTAFQSVKQTFTAADSDKTVFTFEKEWLRILHPEAKVSFKLTTSGQEYTFDTRLKIEKPVVDEPFFDHSALFSFTSGSGGFGFTIPGDVPFISGSTLSLSIPGNYPTLMILPSGMGMFSWGYDFAPEKTTWKTDDTQDQERAIKAFDKQSAADKLLAAARRIPQRQHHHHPQAAGRLRRAYHALLRPCRGCIAAATNPSNCAETAARRLPLRRASPKPSPSAPCPSLPGSISAWAPASASASA